MIFKTCLTKNLTGSFNVKNNTYFEFFASSLGSLRMKLKGVQVTVGKNAPDEGMRQRGTSRPGLDHSRAGLDLEFERDHAYIRRVNYLCPVRQAQGPELGCRLESVQASARVRYHSAAELLPDQVDMLYRAVFRVEYVSLFDDHRLQLAKRHVHHHRVVLFYLQILLAKTHFCNNFFVKLISIFLSLARFFFLLLKCELLFLFHSFQHVHAYIECDLSIIFVLI